MTSLQKHSTINLVVAHGEDAAAKLAVARVADLVKSGAVDPLLHVWTDDHTPLPQAEIIGGSGNVANVTEVLAEVRKLDRVRIIGLFCPSAGLTMPANLTTQYGQLLTSSTRPKAQPLRSQRFGFRQPQPTPLK